MATKLHLRAVASAMRVQSASRLGRVTGMGHATNSDMAFAGVVCAVCHDPANLLIVGKLGEPIEHNRFISDEGSGSLDCAGLRCSFDDDELDFAPGLPFEAAMITAVSPKLDPDPRSIYQQLQPPRHVMVAR